MNQLAINRDASMIAYEINIIKDQANKYLLHSSIEIGQRLKDAKEMVGHGNWTNWLEEEVNYSQRTASNLIKICEEYTLNTIENSNSQALANLGYTQAVAMLKLDFEEREDFVIENNVEEMSTRELENAIKEKKALQKEKKTLQEELVLLGGSNKGLTEKLTKQINKIESNNKILKQHVDEISELKKQINEKSDSNDSDEIEKLNSEIKNKKQEIIKLKQEIEIKPEKIEVQQISYEMPEGVQEEIEELKVKLNASENAVKFKTTFELLMNSFNNLIEILDDIKLNESVEYEKYKGAINKLLGKLAID